MTILVYLLFFIFILAFILKYIDFIIVVALIIVLFRIFIKIHKKNNTILTNNYDSTESFISKLQNSTDIPPKINKNSDSTAIQKEVEYNVILKNDVGYFNNMNLNRYLAEGIYLSTNRKRKREFYGHSTEDAKAKALTFGFAESVQVIKIDFDRPSEAQIDIMKKHNLTIPLYASKSDISAIISKHVNHDSTPNPELIEFATGRNILLSNYIGKKNLYNLLWNELKGIDKIAFFIFSIYRYATDDRLANLDKSPHRAIFYTISAEFKDDSSFIKSMERYSGKDLRFLEHYM